MDLTVGRLAFYWRLWFPGVCLLIDWVYSALASKQTAVAWIWSPKRLTKIKFTSVLLRKVRTGIVELVLVKVKVWKVVTVELPHPEGPWGWGQHCHYWWAASPKRECSNVAITHKYLPSLGHCAAHAWSKSSKNKPKNVEEIFISKHFVLFCGVQCLISVLIESCHCFHIV